MYTNTHDIEITEDPQKSLALYQTSINNPVVIKFPQNNYVSRSDLQQTVYPNAARSRKLDKEHADLFKVDVSQVCILELRIKLQEYLKVFDSQARDIWKQD